MLPRLEGRSSLWNGAADMEASHRLNRCDAHASHYTALGDRSGQSIKRSPLSAHRCAHERVAYHESYTGKIHTTHTRCSMPSPENRKCQFMKCTTRFRGSIFGLVRHSMLVPARTSHKVKTGNEHCIGGLSWCTQGAYRIQKNIIEYTDAAVALAKATKCPRVTCRPQGCAAWQARPDVCHGKVHRLGCL